MFQVTLTNFDRAYDDKFSSFELAVAFAKSKGFEAIIHQKGVVFGTWSPINGAVRY